MNILDKLAIVFSLVLFMCVCMSVVIMGIDHRGKAILAENHRAAALTNISLAGLGEIKTRRA